MTRFRGKAPTIRFASMELFGHIDRPLGRMWGWLGDWTSQDYIVLEEIARMKLHQKVAAVLVSSLGLVSWGCSGDDVESGVNKVGDGVQSTGKKIESAGEALHDKAEGIGKAVGKAEKVVADGAHKAVEGVKDGAHKAVEGAKNIKDKVVEEGKELKEKAANAIDKSKSTKD